METGSEYRLDGEAAPRGWHRALLPLGALALAVLLLATWMNALAAPAGIPPASGLAAPSASNYNFAISISKPPPPANLVFTVGSNNTYVLNVNGTITTTAASPVVNDPLPAGMRIVKIETDNKWDCSTSTNIILNCTYIEALPTGVFDSNNNIWIPVFVNLTPIRVFVNVLPSVQATVVNTATLLISDNIIGDNVDSVVTVIDSVDLEIVKTLNPLFVENEGDPITYTLVITNYGPAMATGVYVKESIPTGLSTLTPVPPNPNFNPVTGIWNIGTLAKDSRLSLVLTANTLAGTNGKVIQNTATVSYTNKSDYNPGNNSDSAFFVVGGIDIEKKIILPHAPPIYVGEIFEYRIVLTTGQATASLIRVTEPITTGLEIVERSSTAGFTSPTTNALIWNISSLAAGRTATLSIKVRPNKTITEPKIIKNQATLAWGSPTVTKKSNNTEVLVAPAPDLRVVKDDGLTEVYRGDLITYTITIDNIGSLEIGDLVITDTFDSYLMFEALTAGTGQTIDPLVAGTNFRSWFLDKPDVLKPTDTALTMRIRFKVASNAPVGEKLVNRIEVRGARKFGEAYFENNIDFDNDDKVIIAPVTSIQATYDVNPTQAKVGETLTFKVVIKNTGDNSIKNLQVGDVYPNVLDFSSGSSTDRGTLTTNSSNYSWLANLAELKKGETMNIVIVTKVNSNAVIDRVYSTRADLVWSGPSSLSTNNVLFKVIGSGTLPNTGEDGTQAEMSAFSLLLLGLGLALGFSGAVALLYGLWARQQHPLWAGNYTRAGMALLFVGVLVSGVSFFFQTPTAASRPLAMPKTAVPEYIPADPIATQLAAQAIVHDVPHPPTEPPEATLQILEHNPTDPAVQVIEADPNFDPTQFLPTPTPSRLPDFPIPTPTFLPTVGPNGGAVDASPITRLVIPRLNLDAVVKYVPFNGDTWLIGGLKQEIAWMGETSWPGLGGNTGLAGHVDLADGSDGPFRRLAELQPGDQVIIYTERFVYTYQVREQTVVPDTDLSVIQPTDNPQITLITCTNYDRNLRTYIRRLIVFANLVNTRPR